MRRKKMDVSPDCGAGILPARSGRQDACTTIPIANRPLSPWLRLAHLSGNANPKQSSHNAYVRTLLDFELVLQVSGSGWIWSDPHGGSVDIQSGELAFIPPGFAHGWGMEPGQHIAVHFDFHAQPSMVAMDNIRMTSKLVTRKPIECMPQFDLVSVERASVLVERTSVPVNEGVRALRPAPLVTLPLVTPLRAPALWREKLEPLMLLYSRRAHHTFSAQLLAAETLGWALRTLIADAGASIGAGTAGGAARESDAQILTLLRELEIAPAERQSVAALAQRAHMGLTAFRDAFHRVTGRSPRAYLEERRIERAARRLLETDRHVLEIAESEGFDDPYHFSRVFKRVTGVSPRGYRQRGRK